MLFKNANFALLWLKKIWLLKIINNVRSITKSDQAIEVEPTTYCNILYHQNCCGYLLLK